MRWNKLPVGVIERLICDYNIYFSLENKTNISCLTINRSLFLCFSAIFSTLVGDRDDANGLENMYDIEGDIYGMLSSKLTK